MADINQVVTLGIGTPSGIKEFLTFGLQIDTGTPIIYSGDAAIRLTATSDGNTRTTSSGDAETRITASAGVEI